MLDDDDSVVTGPDWQWARAGTDIATSASYTVAEEDAGMSLEVTATYDDVHGTGKMVSATVMIAAADPLLVKYDREGDGIDRGDVIAAIIRYFDGEEGVSRTDVIGLIILYFDS